jgi:hypothetical protein
MERAVGSTGVAKVRSAQNATARLLSTRNDERTEVSSLIDVPCDRAISAAAEWLPTSANTAKP